MVGKRDWSQRLGDEPPILADGRQVPDRREVSLRWLSGTFLTGITSTVLMGVALFAALDGRQQLAIPGEAVASTNIDAVSAEGSSKGGRVFLAKAPTKPADRQIMEVSTMVRDGDRDVVTLRPFSRVKIALAANHGPKPAYPGFDPLAIFSQGEAGQSVVEPGIIYGAQVETEVRLRTIEFPLDGGAYAYAASMDVNEVEEAVRVNGSALVAGQVEIAQLNYVDPQRFAALQPTLDFAVNLNARVVQENVSVSNVVEPTDEAYEFIDDILTTRTNTDAATLLAINGYSADMLELADRVMNDLRGTSVLEKDSILRVGLEQIGDKQAIARLSIYLRNAHQITVARDDSGAFKVASRPPDTPTLSAAFTGEQEPIVTGRELPRVYDGIYQGALAYGMDDEMVGTVIRLLASNVDFQSQLKSADTLEAFFSAPAEDGSATTDSELLYLDARFGKNQVTLYRFQDPTDNTVDYFDADGRSARQFLLRKTVPAGAFRSPFGMRRHPITGVRRMHSGVDWSAPRGTPIIAAGNGVVEKAGWHSGGYGRQTKIRHANGYVSSYSHQNSIAKGVVPGARVKQGQIIGYVGSTGLSTGPHLHYELIVNGAKVDPMRVRLPDGKSLDGAVLVEFQRERDRIDLLLGKGGTDVAALAGG